MLVVAAPATSTRRVASYDPSAASIDLGNALAVQRDGTIVVGGLSRRYGQWNYALARYGPNGWLDLRFGAGGLVLTAFRSGVGALAVAEAPARKLLAVGGVSVSDYQSGFGLVRYTRRGRLDPTFGGDGKVVTTFARPRRGQYAGAVARDVVVQRDGGIVVAGSSSAGTVARYLARGVLDRNFGAGGRASSAPGSDLTAIALQRDGKIVVAGSTDVPALEQTHFLVARFTSRGRLDRAFGSGGSTITTLGSASGAKDVAIQRDGRIVVAGSVHARGAVSAQLGVVRLLANGRIDTTFGTNGTVLTNFALNSEPSLALQPDGKIVAACGLSDLRRFGIARYLPDGCLDPTFGEGGKVRTRFRERSVARDVAVTRAGKILVAGSVGGDFALARYKGDGSLDTTFGIGGLVTTPLGPAWVER